MKILLIASNIRAQAEPSLGIGYLASYLTKYSSLDLKIKILNYMPNNVSRIVNYQPDLIGFSVITNQYRKAIQYAKILKRELDVPYIIGGHHISIVPDSLDPVFDVAVLGEGEQTFLELIDCIDKHGLDKNCLKEIDGLLFKDNNQFARTKKRQLIDPLDKIPYPSRELFNMEFMLNEKQNAFGTSFGRGTYMLTSRGCPFSCVFCSPSRFWERIRYNSPEYVIGEINQLINEYGVKYIHVYDDICIAHKKRLKKIVEMIREERINEKVEFGMYGRADIFDEEIAKLLKDMNTTFVEFGIESGTQRILDFLKCGDIEISQVESSVALVKKYGMKVGGTFVIGTPTETAEEMLSTLDLIRDLKLDKFAFSTLCPFPGTELWDYALEEELLPETINWDTLGMKKTTQILIDRSISPQRFAEIIDIFERERLKVYDFKWEEVVPVEEPSDGF